MSAQPQTRTPQQIRADYDQVRADYMRDIAQIQASVSATLAQADADSKRMSKPFWRAFPFVGGAATAMGIGYLVHLLF